MFIGWMSDAFSVPERGGGEESGAGSDIFSDGPGG